MRKKQTIIETALQEHTPTLMAIPGVVGTAQTVDAMGRPSIVVYVSDVGAELLQKIPKKISGFNTAIVQSGQFHALQSKPSRKKP